ncbi:MAG: type III pantothenate kinase [Elusimicrobiota bacterium]|nr:type III pantothenate kinase [Elusimicrobiota bacterium]
MNLLTIDIGNTTVTVGLFSNDKLKFILHLPANEYKSNSKFATAILAQLKRNSIKKIDNVAICSVVPKLDSVFRNISRKYFNCKRPFFVNYKNAKLKIHYHKRADVGADRLSNAVAGYRIFGGPIIVVDFGTAITFDCVNRLGEYRGGLILPGIEISLKALHNYTSKLPLVEMKHMNKSRSYSLVSKSTIESISTGIYFGYIGMLKYLLDHLKGIINCNKVVATGGYAKLFSKKLNLKVIPELTLLGVKYIFEKNCRVNRQKRG